MTDNMKIWNSVAKTDPAYTKTNNQGGRTSTSINTNYMVMRATEVFGPIGSGWGFRVVEERFDKTQPIMVGDDPMVVDGDAIWMLDHTIKLELWHGSRENTIEQFGHTPYRYYSAKNNRIIIDADYAKKTLSDALKKCLSLIGVCADIFLGEFDDFNYQKEVAEEIKVQKAVEKSTTQLEKIQEIRGKIESSLALMKTAKTWNEAEKIYGGAVSELQSSGPILGMNVQEEQKEIDAEYFESKKRLGAE